MKRWLLGLAPALVMSHTYAAGVIYQGTGIAVAPDNACFHNVAEVVNFSGTGYPVNPNFKPRMNAVRLYGMNGIEWGNSTEKTRGVYTWTTWDQAAAKLRAGGTSHWTYTIYNPPQFYASLPHNYGGWRGQDVDETGLVNWLNAITKRYPEIDTIEVANEVVSKTIGAFWQGDGASLANLSRKVLRWRQASGYKGKIIAPSIPGFLDNVNGFFSWLDQYPDLKAGFDGYALHLYGSTGDTMQLPSGPANGWTAFVEYKKAMDARGLNKPIYDNEHGWWFPAGSTAQQRADIIYNSYVRSAIMGVRQLCAFGFNDDGGGSSEAQPWGYASRPSTTPEVLAAFEDASKLGGTTITKVVDNGTGRWVVTTSGTAPAATPATSPTPVATTPVPATTPTATPTTTPVATTAPATTPAATAPTSTPAATTPAATTTTPTISTSTTTPSVAPTSVAAPLTQAMAAEIVAMINQLMTFLASLLKLFGM